MSASTVLSVDGKFTTIDVIGTTDATSTTTGAVTVAGGVGINGTLIASTITGDLVNCTLSLDDSSTAFTLSVISDSSPVLTANRSLTLDVNDANRTIDITGNITLASDFITAGANSLTLTTTAATNVTLPTTGTLATLTGTEILTNKTLTLPQINDTSLDHQYIFAVNELAADRTITLPLLTGNDVFVFEGHTQTLTNKTLAGAVYSTTLTASAAGSHLGVGQLVAPAQITAAATNLITVGTDEQIQVLDFGAGAGTYTYNLDLDTTGAVEGSIFYVKITKAASTNPTIVVRNGSGGATLVSINNANSENYGCMFVFDGTNWIKLLAALNDV